MNNELYMLFEQDQEARKGEFPADLGQQDQVRRQRVEEIIAAGGLQTPEDYYYAAIVFQHGGSVEYWRQAYELAKRATELGYEPARWLTAAAYDRWLMGQGKAQKYGTQYVRTGACWKLWPIDPATTEFERAEWNVPSLEESLQCAADMSCDRPAWHKSNLEDKS